MSKNEKNKSARLTRHIHPPYIVAGKNGGQVADKKWFIVMAAVIACFAFAGSARAAWLLKQKLLASDGAAGDLFGYSVSISGDYAIIGASADDDRGSDSGSAYIFKRTLKYIPPGGFVWVWEEQAKLLAADGAADDFFGYSVSISSDHAFVGAFADDDKGDVSGSAYVFMKCPTADLSGDCFVDFADFAIMAAQWLQGD